MRTHLRSWRIRTPRYVGYRHEAPNGSCAGRLDPGLLRAEAENNTVRTVGKQPVRTSRYSDTKNFS